MRIAEKYSREVLLTQYNGFKSEKPTRGFFSRMYEIADDSMRRISLNGSEYTSCLCVLCISAYVERFCIMINNKEVVNNIRKSLNDWDKAVFRNSTQGDALRDFIRQRTEEVQKHLMIYYYTVRGYFVTRLADNPDILAHQTLICSVLDIVVALYHKLNLRESFIPKLIFEGKKISLDEYIDGLKLDDSMINDESINSEPCKTGIQAIFETIKGIMLNDLQRNIDIEVRGGEKKRN